MRRALYVGVIVSLGGCASTLAPSPSVSAPTALAPAPPSYPIPTPDASEQARDAERYRTLPSSTEFVGAKVSASENQLTDEEPIRFDHAKWDTAGLWDSDRPDRLTMPEDGFYRVTAQITVLGAGYEGSPPSRQWIMSVTRNGDPTDFVCADTQTNEDPFVAQLAECTSTDWFLATDYVELWVTPDRTVESNWPGRGNVSPVLVVELVGR